MRQHQVVSTARCALAVVIAIALTSQAHAQTNSGFEAGVSGWTTTGAMRIATGTIGCGVPQGTFQLVVDATGVSYSAMESFMELSAGALAGLGNGPAIGGATPTCSGIKQDVTLIGEQAFTIEWNFLNGEGGAVPAYNDFAFVAIEGTVIELADTASASTGTCDDLPQTGFSMYLNQPGMTGTYTIGFGVCNTGDALKSSELVLDAFSPSVDWDGDGDFDGIDNCVYLPNPEQEDNDSDGVGNVCDNCPDAPNPLQENRDGDTTGDACEPCSDSTECDDGNPCTINFCNTVVPGGLCLFIPMAECCNSHAECEDGDPCTSDLCLANACSSAPIANCCEADGECDDGNVCTTDSCELARNRCQTAPVAGCCTGAGDCDDSNVCTTDTCDVATGMCGNAPITGCCLSDADCDDGSVCTTDVCEDDNTCSNAMTGTCIDDAGCDDGDVCTTDTCDGCSCSQVPIADCCNTDAECDDGDACTVDSCVDNACQSTGMCDAMPPDAMPGPADAMPEPPDAMPEPPDATPEPPDAMTGGAPDARPPTGDGGDDDGCCSVTGRDTRSHRGGALLALLVGLGLTVNRRRRRR